jgi:hypothetical protein
MASNVFVSKILSTADAKNMSSGKISNKKKSTIQADSLGNIGGSVNEDEQADISVDFQDSLDESVSDNENINSDDDDARSDISGSSTSTESLIERSRKYLTDEAGIIVLKTKKLPKTKENFNLILNFDVDGTNKEAQKLKIQQIHQQQQIEGNVQKYLEDQKNFAIQDSNTSGAGISTNNSGKTGGLINNEIIRDTLNKNDNFFDINKIGVDNFNWDSIVNSQSNNINNNSQKQQTDAKSTIHDSTQRYVYFNLILFNIKKEIILINTIIKLCNKIHHIK